MTLLISQDRTAAQKNSIYHFILGKQLFKLKGIDMKTVMINLRCKTTPRTLKSKIISHSSSAPMWSPIHLEHTPFKIGTKPDDPPQNVDKLHLSACSSTITNLDVTCTLDTSCDHLLHLIPPAIHLIKKTSQVLKVLKLNLLMSIKNLWKIIGIHQQMISMNTMNIIYSYSTKRLIPHLTISTIRTLMSVKTNMTSSSMPPTLATPLNYPNSWHNTTMKD